MPTKEFYISECQRGGNLTPEGCTEMWGHKFTSLHFMSHTVRGGNTFNNLKGGLKKHRKYCC